MILGQTMNRMAQFRRPQDASFFTPTLARTSFLSHVHPFRNVMLPMASFRPDLPALPGILRPVPSAAPYAPAVPGAPPQLNGFGHAPGVSPFSFMDTDPARTARTGAWLAVTPGTVRSGVTQAGSWLQSQQVGYGRGFNPAGSF